MNYADNQLKAALAKMLPDDLMIVNKLTHPIIPMLYWKGKNIEWEGEPVKDTELLHLCWMVEKNLTSSQIESESEIVSYWWEICRNCDACEWMVCHASWQQRVIALAKVKGIEI
jgi:hypothetical protein